VSRAQTRKRKGRQAPVGARLEGETGGAGAPAPSPARWKVVARWAGLAALVALLALGGVKGFDSRFVRAKRAELAVGRARTALEAGDVERGRSELRAALALLPEDTAARKQLAALELARGSPEVAFLEYQGLTEMSPEDPDGWIALARLMRASALLEAPEATLDQALEAAPGNAAAHRERGEIRERLGRYLGALEDARAASRAAPDDAGAKSLLLHAEARARGANGAGSTVDLGPPPAPPRRLRPDAQVDRSALGAWTREYWPGRMGELRKTFDGQLQQRDLAEAQRTVDTANLQFPGTIFGPFLAGLLELRRGDPDAAERNLMAALRIAPRSPVLVATLGRVWSRKGGAAYAAGRLMALAERDPKLSIVRYIAARAYIEAGDPLKAEGALRRGLELQPDSPVPYQHLTDFDFGLDRTPEALEVAREGISRFPGSTDLQMMVGQIQAAVGHPEEAVATYRTLLGRRPDLDLARYRMAMLLASRTEPALHQEFLHTLALLANDRPSDPQLLDALGWMHHQAGRDDLARPLLELAVEHSADEPSTRFHLGSVYLASGAGARGREELQRAVDSPRPFPERLEAMRLLRDDPPRH
jgi:predicted Zn-dependent protease